MSPIPAYEPERTDELAIEARYDDRLQTSDEPILGEVEEVSADV